METPSTKAAATGDIIVTQGGEFNFMEVFLFVCLFCFFPQRPWVNISSLEEQEHVADGLFLQNEKSCYQSVILGNPNKQTKKKRNDRYEDKQHVLLGLQH